MDVLLCGGPILSSGRVDMFTRNPDELCDFTSVQGEQAGFAKVLFTRDPLPP